jgi:hypothetical protein
VESVCRCRAPETGVVRERIQRPAHTTNVDRQRRAEAQRWIKEVRLELRDLVALTACRGEVVEADARSTVNLRPTRQLSCA